ncbi:prepilin-type N-terminal cleavage/methylation domain-containing protein, partial [Candidatus Roizmanbacteria bacterium]|nr:prepilin-type N-terminal cleavage/methylation domain-containing protein [Candidatus Roizmanbacteria bacterium]
MTNQKAFTLIEILVVATIIGLLLAGAVASYTTLNRSSRDARRKADAEQIRSALEMYRSNN